MEMTCKRFLYLFAHDQPISVNELSDAGFEITIKGNKITNSDDYSVVVITDPKNMGKLYRFVENSQEECEEVKTV